MGQRAFVGVTVKNPEVRWCSVNWVGPGPSDQRQVRTAGTAAAWRGRRVEMQPRREPPSARCPGSGRGERTARRPSPRGGHGPADTLTGTLWPRNCEMISTWFLSRPPCGHLLWEPQEADAQASEVPPAQSSSSPSRALPPASAWGPRPAREAPALLSMPTTLLPPAGLPQMSPSP